MTNYIDFKFLESATSKAKIQLASIIIADDGDTEVVIFSDPIPGGAILSVELLPGQALLEGEDLMRLCEAVKDIKGSICFDIAPTIEPIEFPTDLTETNRISDTLSMDQLLKHFDGDDGDDDDDDTANWWKNGGQS